MKPWPVGAFVLRGLPRVWMGQRRPQLMLILGGSLIDCTTRDTQRETSWNGEQAVGYGNAFTYFVYIYIEPQHVVKSFSIIQPFLFL